MTNTTLRIMTALPAAAFIGLLAIGQPAHAADYTAELTSSADEGIPPGFQEEYWLEARGEARATEEDDEHVVEFEASNLVPDGLYTVWWVDPGDETEMGPGGGLPDNEFRPDDDGNAEVTLRVPADNDYQRMVVAYHADNQTHGDEPGEMGEVTFTHLAGAWPGPAGEDEDE